MTKATKSTLLEDEAKSVVYYVRSWCDEGAGAPSDKALFPQAFRQEKAFIRNLMKKRGEEVATEYLKAQNPPDVVIKTWPFKTTIGAKLLSDTNVNAAVRKLVKASLKAGNKSKPMEMAGHVIQVLSIALAIHPGASKSGSMNRSMLLRTCESSLNSAHQLRNDLTFIKPHLRDLREMTRKEMVNAALGLPAATLKNPKLLSSRDIDQLLSLLAQMAEGVAVFKAVTKTSLKKQKQIGGKHAHLRDFFSEVFMEATRHFSVQGTDSTISAIVTLIHELTLALEPGLEIDIETVRKHLI